MIAGMPSLTYGLILVIDKSSQKHNKENNTSMCFSSSWAGVEYLIEDELLDTHMHREQISFIDVERYMFLLPSMLGVVIL